MYVHTYELEKKRQTEESENLAGASWRMNDASKDNGYILYEIREEGGREDRGGTTTRL